MDRCKKCGALTALVGRVHRCLGSQSGVKLPNQTGGAPGDPVMAHPFHHVRGHKVEKSRVGKLYRASGGKIPYGAEETSDFAGDGEIAKDRAHRGGRGHLKGQGKSPSVRKAGGHVNGKKNKHRMDRKRGGRAQHSDEKQDRALIKRMLKQEERKEGRADGGRAPPPPQSDPYEERAKITTDTQSRTGSGMRPNPNATYDPRTGKVKGFKGGGKVKGKTIINVMVGQPQQKPPMMMPPPPPMPPPGGMPPGPPGGPPGGPMAGGPPGMPPPGMMPPGPLRARGGSVTKNTSRAVKGAPPMQGRGATSKAIKPVAADHRSVRDAAQPLGGGNTGPGDKMPGQPPGWKQSEKFKTRVQHTDGHTDGPDIGRGRPITYRTGGGVPAPSQPNPPAKPLKGIGNTSRATPAAYAAGPRPSHAEPPVKEVRYPLKTGSKGGEARLEKERGAGRRGAA